MFLYTLGSFVSIPTFVELGTFGVNGGGDLLCCSTISGKQTHTFRVGIKEACPLHTNIAQPHGPIPNLRHHTRDCDELPESSSVKSTINYQQAKKWMQTRQQKRGGGCWCTTVTVTVTVTAAAAVAKVTTEATEGATAEAMAAAAVTKAMVDMTAEAMVKVAVEALTEANDSRGDSGGDGGGGGGGDGGG